MQLAPLLDAGESLIWSGAPRQGLLLRPTDALMIPFSLLWGGFAFFWEFGVVTSGAPLLFRLWGVPFVLVALYMVVGRFFADARVRASTVYGLTNRRAIIVSGVFSKTTSSLPLRTISDISVQERSDRSGTVLLGRPSPYATGQMGFVWPGMTSVATPSFELIPDAKRVHDQLLAAQRAG
ncbi:MAG: PH domain-containing protein [Myxococcota bacterium]